MKRTIFFIIEVAKETFLCFSQGTVRVLQIFFALIKYQHKIESATEATLKLSSSVIDDSNDQTDCPHKLLLTDRQFYKPCKTFTNN